MKNYNTNRNNSKGYNNYTSTTITNNNYHFREINSKAITIRNMMIMNFNNDHYYNYCYKHYYVIKHNKHSIAITSSNN